jgi:leucyl/phenylalanyl-tRNA--protein transferase
MPIYLLEDNDLWFPDPEEFEGDVVAVGGDLSEARILTAYTQGIFPWYNTPGERVWFCPEVRSVLMLEKLHISHSMRNEIRKRKFHCTVDQAFEQVMLGCRSGERENATWIHDEILEAYIKLHQKGYSHSVEVWQGEELVGGLYGSSIGHMFFGESMFSKAANASKFGFIFLAQKLKAMGWQAIDCQVQTSHLQSLGAEEMPRAAFLEFLNEQLDFPSLTGNWGEMECFQGKVNS